MRTEKQASPGSDQALVLDLPRPGWAETGDDQESNGGGAKLFAAEAEIPTPPTREPDALSPAAAREDWRQGLWSHGFWVFVGRVLGVAATLLSNVILARILAPADMGSFLLVISFAGVGSLVAMFGLNGAVLKMIGESLALQDRRRATRVFRLIGILGGASVFVVGLGAPWIVYWLLPGLRITPAIVLAISVAVTLIAIQQITAEALRGMHESRWANLLTGGQISGPITALLLVALVLPLSGIHDVTLGEVLWLTDAALAFTVCMALYFAWRVARARLAGLGRCAAGRAVTYGEVLALCVPLMVANVLIFATSQADVWIAGACFDSDSVALYGVARRVATAVGMLAQITEMSVVASLVTLHAQGRLEEMEQLLRTAATLASLPSLAVLGLILVAGAPLLEFCFGSFYRGAAPVLTVLAVGQVFITWCGACGCVLAFAGRQNVFLLTNLVATIALFAIGLPVGRYFGMLGISWTVTAVTVLQWTAVAWLAHRLVGVRTDATLRAVGSLWRLVRTVEALR